MHDLTWETVYTNSMMNPRWILLVFLSIYEAVYFFARAPRVVLYSLSESEYESFFFDRAPRVELFFVRAPRPVLFCVRALSCAFLRTGCRYMRRFSIINISWRWGSWRVTYHIEVKKTIQITKATSNLSFQEKSQISNLFLLKLLVLIKKDSY